MSFFTTHHKRIQEIGIGLFVYECINLAYDFIFYPFAVAYWGVVEGGIIAAAISLVQCGVMFWLYDYMRVDWLGAHALRELEDKENKSNAEKLLTWMGKKKETLWEKLLSPITFIGLTLPIDPLIVAIHYRRQHFQGVTWRDWSILVAAVVSANAWWLIKVGVVIEIFKYLFHYVQHFF